MTTASPPRVWNVKLWLSVIALSCVAIHAFAWIWYFPRAKVGYLLDLDDVPWSVRSIECASPQLMTDIMMTCAFRIDAEDFPRLLLGEKFSQERKVRYGHAQDLFFAEELGEDFVPAFDYHAQPEDSTFGSTLDLVTDATRTRVMAHLYIE